MKFMLYNVEGLSIPVEAEPGRPFKFNCSEEECGKSVTIKGVILPVSEDEFAVVLNATIDENPDFKAIEEIKARKYIFKGRVNGVETVLPAETFEDFAKRFIEAVDSVLLLR